MATLAGACSFDAVSLIITRFIAGLGIGAEPPLIDAYLTELVPASQRGRLIAWAYTVGFLGVPAVGFLARLLVPISPLGIEGWRWLFVSGSAGSAVAWVLRRRLPESPRWLELHGRRREAEAVVSRMEREALAAHGALVPPGYDTMARRKMSSPRTSFSYRRRAGMLAVFQVCQTIGYYGFGTIVPMVLASRGFSVVTSLTYTAVTFMGYPIGSLLSIPLVERLDRRWLIACAASLMAVLGLGLGSAGSRAGILSLGFAYTAISNVFSNAFHIFQAEIFPTAIRATAAGSTYGISRLSAAAMPFVLLPVLRHSGPTAMFAVIALAMLIAVAAIVSAAPSTTGRVLDEINN